MVHISKHGPLSMSMSTILGPCQKHGPRSMPMSTVSIPYQQARFSGPISSVRGPCLYVHMVHVVSWRSMSVCAILCHPVLCHPGVAAVLTPATVAQARTVCTPVCTAQQHCILGHNGYPLPLRCILGVCRVNWLKSVGESLHLQRHCCLAESERTGSTLIVTCLVEHLFKM